MSRSTYQPAAGPDLPPTPPAPTPAPAMRRSAGICRLVLVALVLLTFGRLATAEFVRWDDTITIATNARLNPPTWSGVGDAWRQWRTGAQGLYIPLTYTVWSALAAVGRVATPQGTSPNPWVFHSANILLHLGATLAAFELLRRLIGSAVAACVGAALFAIHPVQVEAVAWASGMKDVLAGFLSILSLWLYIGSTQAWRASSSGAAWTLADRPGPQAPAAPKRDRSGGRWIAYILALVAFVLAMLSKPSAIMVAPMALVLDGLLLRRRWTVALRSAAPLLLLAIPIMLIARRVQELPPIVAPPIWTRPLIAGDALAFYLRKLAWPVGLAIDYGRRPDGVLQSPLVYVTWIIPALVAALVLWTRSRLAWAAGLLFLLPLLPVLGFTPFLFQQYSTVADHYLYIAMLGPALLIAAVMRRWPGAIALSIASAAIALLAGQSFAQAGYWRDDLALFSHAIHVNPRSAAMHDNLGAYYYDSGNYDQAEHEFRHALELDWRDDTAGRNLVLVYMAKGKIDAAIRQAQAVVAADGPETSAFLHAQDLFRLGKLLLDHGQPSAAIPYLEQANQIRPDSRVQALIGRARQATTGAPTTRQSAAGQPGTR